MKIKKLPADARSKLQSGMIMTDAVQCVKELVHNSLDAEATGVAVRIDLKAYRIWVIDNGKGIKKEDLEFVGERYMTTKYQSLTDLKTPFPVYGFRGQALSCLRDVSSSLTIETKSEENGPTLVKVFKNNKALPITEIDSTKSKTGTTVTIEDFMCTMPVRRKRINEVFDLEEIKNELQYLAIIHYNVCFTLRNENKGLILLQTPQASNILESISNIYGKTLAKSLKALDYSENNYEVTGFISLKPHTQNKVQLLYINKRTISKGIIHKFINNVIKEFREKKILLSDAFKRQILKTLKLSSYNAYVIQIKCPHSYYELYSNMRKTIVEFKNWKDVLKYVHKAIKRAFKYISNSNFISDSQYHDDKNIAILNKKNKRAFGTSFLVNAVKGAPVKRGVNIKKNAKKKKKIKANGGSEKSDTKHPERCENKSDCKRIDNFNLNSMQKEFTNDSLESPIPKRKFNLKMKHNLKVKKSPPLNESYIEFYEWLKTKFETDANAFNLYHDFLQFKNKGNYPKEAAEIKSPDLGGKLKRKQMPSFRKKILENSENKISSDLPQVGEKMAIMTQKQLKIFSNDRLSLKSAVHFTSDIQDSFPEPFNLYSIIDKNLIFEKQNIQSTVKKPEHLSVLSGNQRQIQKKPTLLSLSSSEAQFTNIIKFRNLSESFFRQSSFNCNKKHAEKTFASSALNTWASHYGTVMSTNEELHKKRYNKKNFGDWIEANERNLPEENKSVRHVNLYDFDKSFDLSNFSNKKKKANSQDVKIQVNLLETVIPVPKVNTIVQTDQIISRSPSFENSIVSNKVDDISISQNAKVIFQKHKLLENNLNQEVPNPDFWNTSGHIQFEAEFTSNRNELTAKKLESDCLNERYLASSDFICRHKSCSNSDVQNEENPSKETQTIAAIWTDSLEKFGSPLENTKARITVYSDSKSGNTSLPKTLPIKEIEIHHPVESRFCLTERHDFVPKGLSPEILNPKSSSITILSPREKSRIKLTIDNAQNDMLAIIKWQDESSGDFLKPTLPDGIFFEMRQKVEENATNYENPVLSALLSYSAIKIQNLLHSFAFTKELLAGVEILGQLDKKFIVAKMKIFAPKEMELISLFDQHAVDERIKLEELIMEYLSSDGKFKSSCLSPPINCVLTDSEMRIISGLKEKMFNFGLDFKSVNENTMSVNAIPTYLLNKYESDLKNKRETPLQDLLKSLIANVIDELSETRGTVSKIPKILYNAFCLEACHKAIRFNKALSMENMTEMINKLQNCKLPFQCAHGRPSVIPLIDLEDFKPSISVNDNIDFQGLKKFLNERKDDVNENSENTEVKN